MLHLPPPVHGSSIVGEQIKDSKLINNEFEGRYINLNMSRKVNEIGKASFKKILRFIFTWIHLIGKLFHKKPNLCYYALTTTGSAFFKDCFIVATLKIFNVRIIYHLHNKGVKRKSENKIYNVFYKFIFKNTNSILLSELLYDDVSKYITLDDVFYCSNGIKDYQPKVESIDRTEVRPFNILFLSNLLKAKGVYDLVDACVILKSKGYIFNCDFVGGEGDITSSQFNDYVRMKNINSEVKYLGKRYGNLKEMSYQQADVFVLPSHNECFGLVILEALQHGLPVISTYEGGIPDIIDNGENGFLFQKHNVNDLSEKIEILFNDEELRREFSKNARLKYDQNFRLSIFERKLLSILKEVTK